jgi:hypothetical protein
MAVVLVYFLVVHGVFVHRMKRRAPALWSKEASVGLVFALGASLAAWTNIRTITDAAAIALFFVLCWINCAAIQKWESHDLGRSFRAASQGTVSPVSGSAVGVAVVAVALACMDRPILGGAELASACAFVLLDRARLRLSPDALRVLADVALLSPVVFLPLVRGA